jgi:hypothetical protein
MTAEGTVGHLLVIDRVRVLLLNKCLYWTRALNEGSKDTSSPTARVQAYHRAITGLSTARVGYPNLSSIKSVYVPVNGAFPPSHFCNKFADKPTHKADSQLVELVEMWPWKRTLWVRLWTYGKPIWWIPFLKAVCSASWFVLLHDDVESNGKWWNDDKEPL